MTSLKLILFLCCCFFRCSRKASANKASREIQLVVIVIKIKKRMCSNKKRYETSLNEDTGQLHDL